MFCDSGTRKTSLTSTVLEDFLMKAAGICHVRFWFVMEIILVVNEKN